MIETTININNANLLKLKIASKIVGLPLSILFIYIIREMIKHHDLLLRFNRRIEYQKNHDKTRWEQLHVSLNLGDYEYLLDLKKLTKRSSSLLIAIAIHKYLNLIIERLSLKDRKTDLNFNMFSNYIIIRDIKNDVICWKFFWGFPINIDQLLTKT